MWAAGCSGLLVSASGSTETAGARPQGGEAEGEPEGQGAKRAVGCKPPPLWAGDGGLECP